MAGPSHGIGPDDIVTLDRAAVVARLLAGILHDVNNSLLVISGTTEILDGDPPSPPALAEGLARIRQCSTSAAAAVAEVLAFARGDLAERGPVDLHQLAARALAFRAYSLRRARVSTVITTADEASGFVEGNAVLLLQAILGLLINAEQALAGQVDGRIEVNVGMEQDRVCLRVIDNGPGVAPEHRARVFDPFFTTRRRDESQGLGLAAASAIARSHGGAVTVEETASGASLVLSLPPFDRRR